MKLHEASYYIYLLLLNVLVSLDLWMYLNEEIPMVCLRCLVYMYQDTHVLHVLNSSRNGG